MEQDVNASKIIEKEKLNVYGESRVDYLREEMITFGIK